MKKIQLYLVVTGLISLFCVSIIIAETATFSMTGRHLRYYQYSSSGDNIPKVGAFARGGSGGYCDETIFYADVSSISNATINSVEFRFKVDSIKTQNTTCTANLYEQDKGSFSTSAQYSTYEDESWDNSLGALTLSPTADLKTYTITSSSLANLVQAWVNGNKNNEGIVLAGNFGDAFLYWKVSNAQLYVDYTPANYPPVASNVVVNGVVELNETLHGTYTYSDAESDDEGGSVYQWYRADDASGTNITSIPGANSTDLTLQDEDYMKFVCFEVTTVAQTGTSPGTPVRSSWSGPVTGDRYFYPEHCGAGQNMKVDGKVIVNGATPPDNGVFGIKSGNGNFLQLEKTNGGFWTFHNPASEDHLSIGYTYNNFIQNDYLVIGLNGNVGIGTHENLDAKLCVNGKIKAKEVQVTSSGWADHILRSDYDLRPLNELESYINKNGKLPDIPSEKDVAEKGLSLGEMQKKLLEKIEEISLYLIAINKENNELKNKVMELENGFQEK